jgi:hypothetical protein
MGQSTAFKIGDGELSAHNAGAGALSKFDASAWEEAVDWGVADFRSLLAAEWWNGRIARFRLSKVGKHFGRVNQRNGMMNKTFRSAVIGVALAFALAGCQRGDAPSITSSGLPSGLGVNMSPIPQVPWPDRSVPDASTAFAQDAADKTKAMQDTSALQHKPAPQEKMTKTEESKAMPLPGQANDHSTTANDKNTGG